MLRPLWFILREIERVRNVRDFSRAPRHRRIWPSALGWSAAALSSLACLVALGYFTGNHTPTDRGFWDSLRRTLVKPSVSLPVAFAILTCAAYACRRARLEWLGWRPGRIQVSDFSAPGVTATSAQEITDRFRSRLAGMRLASAVAAPTAPAETDFLDVLGSAGASSSNILATLLGLLRAAVPSFTWEIRGTVVEQPSPLAKYRVSLQITRLPNQGSSEVSCEHFDLDQALRLAADSATAAILPRTRLCKGPWIAWRRYAMPGELFNAYEDACQHETCRRYDLAHELYYVALSYDPMNMMIRLQLGQLQEKLNLFVEALATYTAMDFVVTPGVSSRQAGPKPQRAKRGNGAKRARASALPAGLYPRRAERERNRALLLARYRRAVLLGEGSFLAGWSDRSRDDPERAARRRSLRPQDDPERAARRRSLREQLKPWLHELMTDSHVAGAVELLESAQAARLGRQDEQDLRVALTVCASTEIERLRAALPLAWTLTRRSPLTRRALDLTQLCIAERGRVASPLSGLPRTLATLERDVRAIERRRRFFRRWRLKRWEEHYNAACLFAIALLRNTSKSDPGGYARAAIGRLERAAASADSSFIARQRAWVTTEDPDLNGLRQQPEFKAFEAQYFPTGRPIARRPVKERELVEIRCTRDLLVAAAREWEGAWRARAAAAEARMPPPSGKQWWKDEHDVWNHIYKLAHKPDWRARLELVRAARTWRAGYGIDPIEPVFARYELQALEVGDDSIDNAAKAEIKATKRRLTAVAAAIASDGTMPTAFRGFTWGVPVLAASDAEPATIPPEVRARLCARQAALWQGLQRWLVLADGLAAEDHSRAFAVELKRARRLWRRADRRVAKQRLLDRKLHC